MMADNRLDDHHAVAHGRQIAQRCNRVFQVTKEPVTVNDVEAAQRLEIAGIDVLHVRLETRIVPAQRLMFSRCRSMQTTVQSRSR